MSKAAVKRPQNPEQRIPRSTRGAILNWFKRYGVRPGEVLSQLQLREGFGDDQDLVRHVRETYGEEQAEQLRHEARGEVDAAIRDRLGEVGMSLSSTTAATARDQTARAALPRAVLLHVPDPLFASAIEAACEEQVTRYIDYGNVPPDPTAYVNERLEEAGAPYRLDDNRIVTWVGDEQLGEMAIRPALSALADLRLATAAEDFQHTLRDLRKGTERSRKDAVNYGVKVLEGTMVALLGAYGVHFPSKRQVWLLWEALRGAGIVEESMKELVIAGARVSNEKGRHTDPRDVTEIEAEVSVTAVANAVHYLASLLPQDDPK